MAVKTGQRPTAQILRDPYAGYRDYDNYNWDWERAPYVDGTRWTEWDYALASVAQIIDDYTDKNNGQLYWVDASEKVDWDVRSSFSGYDAAIERAKEDHNFEPGESLYAVPIFNEDDPPTFAEWIQAMEEDEVKPPSARNPGYSENEILDARDEHTRQRQEIMEKLLRGEKL